MTQPEIFANATIGRDSSRSLKPAVLLAGHLVLLAAGYYFAARLGLAFRFSNTQIGVVWPANAVLVSALLLTRRRHWWAVLMIASLAHILATAEVVPGWRIIWQTLTNSVFATITVEALRRFAGLPLHFGSRRQAVAFTAIAFVAPAVLAFMSPSFVRSVFGLEHALNPTGALLRVILSNGAALLLIVPVVILWAGTGLRQLRDISPRSLREAILIMALLLGVGGVAFGSGPRIAQLSSTLLWVFPPLLWAAVRFGPLGASTALLSVAALSICGTAWQLGPFVLQAAADSVLALEVFWIVMCAPIMLLAAVIRERDLVESALLEQRNQLAHVTRVATVGELSGALAHELRQPLMAILANAQTGIRLLARNPVDLTEMHQILQDIAQQDKHAAGIITRLRDFLKEGEPRFATLAVDSVVRDALALSRSAIRLSRVDVQTQIPVGLPRVWGDRVQLLQVVVNLLVNGCESMYTVPEDQRRLRLRAVSRGREHVEVLIVDSGTGLPQERADRVFEPFYTTKKAGLGLGLAIGRSIVAAHGGRLWAENNLHRGATFHLLLRTEGANGESAATDRDN